MSSFRPSPLGTEPILNQYSSQIQLTPQMGDSKGFTESTLADTNSSKSQQLEQFPIPPTPQANKRRKLVFWAIRYALTVVLVAVALLIPVLTTAGATDVVEEDAKLTAAKQYRNLIFYIFLWLFVTWIGTCAMDIFFMTLPYLFRFVSKWVNPAHNRYWRIFRVIRKPFTVVMGTVICYSSFSALVNNNELVAINATVDPNTWRWDDTINDILQQLTFAVAFYAAQKILILYISIHYHSRSESVRNSHSKDIYGALATLYQASTYVHPVGSAQFKIEDTLMKRPGKDISGISNESQEAGKFLDRVGFRRAKKARYFGDVPNKSHWFAHGSAYAAVERAMQDSKSAAALATRIWRSLVAQDEDILKASDIEEVLGPYRINEAQKIFKTIDENESKDIKLDEMVMTVFEAGRVRSAIYKGMVDIDHCLNSFEWIIILIITIVMTYFVLILYVPTIQKIQTTVSVLFVGLGFAVGRTVNKFLYGCIFVFFDHPFDIGDRVQVYNMASTAAVSCTVKHQSLLYTVFTRLDNQQDLQITNERLALKRIENVTRSGANRETRAIFVDIKTTFVDIMHLRTEMEAFLRANPRDYMPNLGLSVVDVPKLTKIQLNVAWVHKNNWSNEPLRAKRSARFMCALIAAIRKVPILKPGGITLGTEDRPYWTAQLDGEEGSKLMTEKRKAAAAAKIDALRGTDKDALAKKSEAMRKEDEAREKFTKVPAALTAKKGESSSVDLDGLHGAGRLGLRNKSGQGGGGLYYPS